MDEKIVELLQQKVDKRIGQQDIEVVPDGQILSLFAVRTGEGKDYLVNTLAGAVEKVRFDEWPPR